CRGARTPHRHRLDPGAYRVTAQAVVETSAATTITSAAFGKGDQGTRAATSAPAKSRSCR
ncbi:MAG: hypothetical protein WBQ29_22865, partial [Isosphaeraceae bacterium]